MCFRYVICLFLCFIKTTMHTYLRVLTVFLSLSLYMQAAAQQPSDYFAERSATVYKPQIEKLKSRTVPIKYEKKDEQKTYADLVKQANKYAYTALEKNEVIDDSFLLSKCRTIIQKLKAKNPTYPWDSVTVYINRSSICNAMNIGQSGTVFVNLGLFLWMDNDDELALILGHEYAHYFLKHMDQALEKNMAILQSDDYKDEVKFIKKTKDGKYERLKNLLKDFSEQTGKHSRYKEAEADSLSAVFISNAGYNVEKAAFGILKLDNVEQVFTADSLYQVKEFFERSVDDPGMFREAKKYNGLSTLNVTMNADAAIDSIKTHPDCVIRYKELTKKTSLPQVKCCTAITAENKQVKDRALTEIVRNLYENGNLTLCIHFCMFAIRNGYKDPLYNYLISASFSDIYYADKKLVRFSYTNANASTGSSMKKLQDFIFKANAENVSKMAVYFLNNDVDISSDDYYFAQLRYDEAVRAAEPLTAESKFKSRFPTSKYNYLFTKSNLTPQK